MKTYGKILRADHGHMADLLSGPVVVEEKIDGSQIRFGVFDGKLRISSRRVKLHEGSEGMFGLGCAAIREAFNAGKLLKGHTYCGEYLAKPKHNTLAYEDVPSGYIAIWELLDKAGNPSPRILRAGAAVEAGFDEVPVVHVGETTMTELRAMLDRESYLGGQKVEGLVIKNYAKPGPYGGPLLVGKLVSDRFKELNDKDFRARNPTQSDFMADLIDKYRCEARWEKAIQRMRDDGTWTGTPKDIGTLMKSIVSDVADEESEAIKDALWKHFGKQFRRGVTRGFPEWYKEQLQQSTP